MDQSISNRPASDATLPSIRKHTLSASGASHGLYLQPHLRSTSATRDIRPESQERRRPSSQSSNAISRSNLTSPNISLVTTNTSYKTNADGGEQLQITDALEGSKILDADNTFSGEQVLKQKPIAWNGELLDHADSLFDGKVTLLSTHEPSRLEKQLRSDVLEERLDANALLEKHPHLNSKAPARTIADSKLPVDAHVIARSLFPRLSNDEDLEDLQPYLGTDGKWYFSVFPTRNPTSRREVHFLGKWMEKELKKRNWDIESNRIDQTSIMKISAADIKGINDTFDACFHEISRQISIQCNERGRLLDTVWDQKALFVHNVLKQNQSFRDTVASLQTQLEESEKALKELKTQAEDLKKQVLEISKAKEFVHESKRKNDQRMFKLLYDCKKSEAIIAELQERVAEYESKEIAFNLAMDGEKSALQNRLDQLMTSREADIEEVEKRYEGILTKYANRQYRLETELAEQKTIMGEMIEALTKSGGDTSKYRGKSSVPTQQTSRVTKAIKDSFKIKRACSLLEIAELYEAYPKRIDFRVTGTTSNLLPSPEASSLHPSTESTQTLNTINPSNTDMQEHNTDASLTISGNEKTVNGDRQQQVETNTSNLPSHMQQMTKSSSSIQLLKSGSVTMIAGPSATTGAGPTQTMNAITQQQTTGTPTTEPVKKKVRTINREIMCAPQTRSRESQTSMVVKETFTQSESSCSDVGVQTFADVVPKKISYGKHQDRMLRIRSSKSFQDLSEIYKWNQRSALAHILKMSRSDSTMELAEKLSCLLELEAPVMIPPSQPLSPVDTEKAAQKTVESSHDIPREENSNQEIPRPKAIRMKPAKPLRKSSFGSMSHMSVRSPTRSPSPPISTQNSSTETADLRQHVLRNKIRPSETSKKLSLEHAWSGDMDIFNVSFLDLEGKPQALTPSDGICYGALVTYLDTDHLNITIVTPNKHNARAFHHKVTRSITSLSLAVTGQAGLMKDMFSGYISRIASESNMQQNTPMRRDSTPEHTTRRISTGPKSSTISSFASAVADYMRQQGNLSVEISTPNSTHREDTVSPLPVISDPQGTTKRRPSSFSGEMNRPVWRSGGHERRPSTR
eukprot:TRINITY_DN7474_c0_g1_i23.p1 TRINITY_DN7474_c0_g1~~TRINITY_DN7474_c0_g1_i23.p1  ORF type:complete len:1086 (+),score=192.36 TRINITY_DN7474_c0_g1_i23:111-3368(+)